VYKCAARLRTDGCFGELGDRDQVQLEACTFVNYDSCKTAGNGLGFVKLWMWVAEELGRGR